MFKKLALLAAALVGTASAQGAYRKVFMLDNTNYVDSSKTLVLQPNMVYTWDPKSASQTANINVDCPQPKPNQKNSKNKKGFTAYITNLSGSYLDVNYKGEYVASVDDIVSSSYVSALTLICVDGVLGVSWQNST